MIGFYFKGNSSMTSPGHILKAFGFMGFTAYRHSIGHIATEILYNVIEKQ